MSDKITIQDIIELLAEKHGMNKKDAEIFVKGVFDLIEEALASEKYVKVKGLGTFKLTEVESRESVNVNTGERFQIQGHNKISFAPDATMKDLINKPFAHFETVILNQSTQLEDTETEIEGEDEKEEGTEEVTLEKEEVASKREKATLEREDVILEKKEIASEQEKYISEGEQTALKQQKVTSTYEIVEEAPSENPDEVFSEVNDGKVTDEIMTNEVVTETEANQSEPEKPEAEIAVIEATKEEEQRPTEKQHLADEPHLTEEKQMEEHPLPEEESKDDASLVKEALEEKEYLVEETPKGEMPKEERNIPEEETITIAEAAMEATKKEKTISDTIAASETITEAVTTEPESTTTSEAPVKEEKKKTSWGIIIAIILILCIAGGIYWFMQSSGKQPVKQSPAAPSVTAIKAEPKDSVTPQRQDTTSVGDLPTDKKEQPQPTETPAQKQQVKSENQSIKSAINQEVAKVTLADTVEYDIVGTKTNHTLQEGESLIKLALKFYGTKKLWPYIVKHNKNVIKDADRVPIGTTLRIPELTPKKQ